MYQDARKVRKKPPEEMGIPCFTRFSLEENKIIWKASQALF